MKTLELPVANLVRLAVLALALQSCAVGPTYHKPTESKVRLPSDPHFSQASPRAAWWTSFDDPVLGQLETRALQGSPDLKVALARVRGARAAFSESLFDLAPHVTLDGAYSRSKEQFPGFGTQRLDIESRSVGFDAAWELDLFGHVRREAAAARATLEEENFNFQAVQVTLAGEVARNYFELRGTQRQIAVAQDNIENEREALRLTQVRYEAGRVTELDPDSARARLKATEATVPLLKAAEKRFQYRLAVLVGVEPGSIDQDLTSKAVPATTTQLPIGDVTDLLRRRPDVRSAERTLAAATEGIGVATADLFPRITFNGFIGFLAGDGSQLGRSASRAWSASPTVSWPGLDLGAARARVRAAKSQAEGALASYEKAVLLAIEDFQNACVNYSAQQSRLGSVIEQAQASQHAAALAAIQYKEGSINFLVLIDAQRTLLQAEDELARAEADANTGAVAVYKALGGVDDSFKAVAATTAN